AFLSEADGGDRPELDGPNAGQYVYTFEEGETINIALSGADDAMDLFMQIVGEGIEVMGEVDGGVNTLEFKSSTNLDFTINVTGVSGELDSAGGAGGVADAADVLEGGAGDDLYIIAFSQLDPAQMTTIKGLDLGGVGAEEAEDRINLGTLFAIGDYDANVAGELYSILNTANAFHLGEDGQGIVNNGLPIDITNTGATLQQAVNELFAANG